MSFAGKVKHEICEREPKNTCCVTAACYGVACFGKYFDARGVVLHTEKEFVAQWARRVFELADIHGDILPKGSPNKPLYEFAIKEPYQVEKALALLGHTGEELALRIHRDIFMCSGCVSFFVAAAFLCCGTVVDPAKGYNLEFVSNRYSMMQDFSKILTEQGFTAKVATRKGYHLLYLKASEQIEDLLTYMGASMATLEIINEKIYKDFRNKANRISNCENANIDKMLASNLNVLRDISVIEERQLFSSLPQPLQEAAILRKEHPELSLGELAALLPTPVSKSGLSHRFRKLSAIASKLKVQEKPDRKELF